MSDGLYSIENPHPEALNADAEAAVRGAYEAFVAQTYPAGTERPPVIFKFWYAGESAKRQRFVIASIEDLVKVIVGGRNLWERIAMFFKMERADVILCPSTGWWVTPANDDDWLWLGSDSSAVTRRYEVIAQGVLERRGAKA